MTEEQHNIQKINDVSSIVAKQDKALQEYLNANVNKFEIFEVEYGGMLGEELYATLEKNNVPFNWHVEHILNNPDFKITKETTLDKVIILTKDCLGFEGEESVNIYDLLDKANKLGLELCPVDLAPFFRLGDLDKSHDGMIIVVVTEVLSGYQNEEGLFCLNQTLEKHAELMFTDLRLNSGWKDDYYFMFKLKNI